MVETLIALALLGLRLSSSLPEPAPRANTIAPDRPPSPVEARQAARALYEARDFEAALPLAEEAADLAWREHGPHHYRTLCAEEFLAHLAALGKDPERARALRAETDRKLERLGDPDVALKVRIARAEEYRETAELE